MAEAVNKKRVLECPGPATINQTYFARCPLRKARIRMNAYAVGRERN